MTGEPGQCEDRCEGRIGHPGYHQSSDHAAIIREATAAAEQRLAPNLRGDGPCKDCGTLDNIVWFTENVLWNRVTGETVYAEESRGAILCIPCFVTRADRAGLNPTGWRLLPEWPWRETVAALSEPAEAGEP